MIKLLKTKWQGKRETPGTYLKTRNWEKALLTENKRMDYLDDPLGGTLGSIFQRWR